MSKDFTNITKNVVDLRDMYYLWIKYQQYNYHSLGSEYYKYKEYRGEMPKKNFYLIFELKLTEINIKMAGSYNGQSKAEFAKNFKRVKDIISKSEGDVDKAIRLARNQANLIKDEMKALNRANAAQQMEHVENEPIYENIFEVFFQRAYELGSVSKQDYRNYKLEKLGI
jgi:hypothetical protein